MKLNDTFFINNKDIKFLIDFLTNFDFNCHCFQRELFS